MARARKPQDDAKAQIQAQWLASPFTNRPQIQADEADDVAAYLATAAANGLTGADAESYAMHQLQLQRLRAWSFQRSLKRRQDDRAREMREERSRLAAVRKQENRERAEAALAIMRGRYAKVETQKNRAAEMLEISRSTFDRWLRG